MVFLSVSRMIRIFILPLLFGDFIISPRRLSSGFCEFIYIFCYFAAFMHENPVYIHKSRAKQTVSACFASFSMRFNSSSKAAEVE